KKKFYPKFRILIGRLTTQDTPSPKILLKRPLISMIEDSHLYLNFHFQIISFICAGFELGLGSVFFSLLIFIVVFFDGKNNNFFEGHDNTTQKLYLISVIIVQIFDLGRTKEKMIFRVHGITLHSFAAGDGKLNFLIFVIVIRSDRHGGEDAQDSLTPNVAFPRFLL
ncbi:hypothetical protein ACJX0J_017044, partial [Zea mays]